MDETLLPSTNKVNAQSNENYRLVFVPATSPALHYVLGYCFALVGRSVMLYSLTIPHESGYHI